MELAVIIAASENDVIGRGNRLPWHIGSDLRRFKSLTMGHPIVMGRKTFESLGRVLPGRLHVVVTRDATWKPPADWKDREQVRVVHSWPEAKALLDRLPDQEKAFVIGGAELFSAAIPDVSYFYMTRVLATVDGDVTLPEVDWSQWQLVQREQHSVDDRNDHSYAFEDYQRL